MPARGVLGMMNGRVPLAVRRVRSCLSSFKMRPMGTRELPSFEEIFPLRVPKPSPVLLISPRRVRENPSARR